MAALDQARPPGKEFWAPSFKPMQSSAVVHPHPKTAVPAFVEGQNLLRVRPAHRAVSRDLVILQPIQAPAPGSDPDRPRPVLANRHGIVASQALLRGVSGKARRVQAIQAVLRADPDVALAILENGVNLLLKDALAARLGESLSLPPCAPRRDTCRPKAGRCGLPARR